MHTSVRSLHIFDARSVLLFTAIAVSSGAAMRAHAAEKSAPHSFVIAQAQSAPAVAQKSSAPPMTTSPAFGPGDKSGLATGGANNPDTRPEIEATSPSAATTAFDRADSNKDGQLSVIEARKLPAISERFQVIDANNDGYLSRDEFDTGAKF